MSIEEQRSQSSNVTSLIKIVFKNFPQSVQSIDGVIADFFTFIREKNALKYSEKLQRLKREKNLLDTRAVPLSFGVPLLQAALLEEEEILQEIWAHLLVNAMDPSFDITNVRGAFIDIAKGLSPLDARILHYWEKKMEDGKAWPLPDKNLSKFPLHENEIRAELNIPEKACLIALYNLMRMQCLTPYERSGIVIDPISIIRPISVEKVILTPLGHQFMLACMN